MWKLQHENQHIRYRSSPAGFEERSAQGPLRLRQQGENRRRDEFAKSSGLNMQERSDRFYSVNTPLNNHSALWPLRVGAKRRFIRLWRIPLSGPREMFTPWNLFSIPLGPALWNAKLIPLGRSYFTGELFHWGTFRFALRSLLFALCALL